MAKTNSKEQQTKFSQQEVEAIKDQGRKLGFLLKGSSLPEKVKQELASLVPYMKLEQIDRLIEVLEVRAGMEDTVEADKEVLLAEM